MEQPLTQRADQPLRPRSKHRVRSRGKQQVAPKLAQQQTQDQPILPADAPVPEPRPAEAQKAGTATLEEQKAAGPKDADASDPINQEKSREGKRQHPEPSATEPSTDTEGEPEAPSAVPIPTQRPDIAEPKPPAAAPKPPEKPADTHDNKILPDPRSAELPADKMPAEEVACRERLKTLGVEFEEHKAEHDAEIGCSIPYPIVMKTLGKSISIGAGAELNCQMAEAAARFAVEVIQPAAKAEFGADLKSIGQASAFVCRPRNGGGKLSEHAFGNALDIASFTLSDGRTIEVGPVPPEKDANFLNTIRKAACGPFKTVLGPGSDPDHALHFHFDLEPRRNGGRFCQ
ncbi:extensin family protein [Mesorhizobium sp. M1A.F.Ca.ET.072.01.1.1]|uniref:extensin family protein n=1 Tax=Mesorhizobium sp. M1A.F.Ca.ET.072.01.1.1 TaxID=2496753 RepID=UPI000FD5A624|nr:extensin family protein [Mesorhizobium sp. M1A.F.Ca.ET.072.01.1.1]RUW52291.1 extensin family protein [Mesorhizobium sp. M1A.F.Ca.ET.072.01.1.1]